MTNQKEEMSDEAYRILCCINAVIENDHFVYDSGKHGSVYVSHQDIYTNPFVVSKLAFWLTRYIYPILKNRIDIILTPTNGCIALGQWLAYYLGQLIEEKRVLVLWAEKSWFKEENKFVLPPMFEKYIINKDVLIVDDIVTSGGSIKDLARLVVNRGSRVSAGACLWNRGLVKIENLPLISLIEKKLDDWNQKECLLCRDGVLINTDYGHGKEFLKDIASSVNYDHGGESG